MWIFVLKSHQIYIISENISNKICTSMKATSASKLHCSSRANTTDLYSGGIRFNSLLGRVLSWFSSVPPRKSWGRSQAQSDNGHCLPYPSHSTTCWSSYDPTVQRTYFITRPVHLLHVMVQISVSLWINLTSSTQTWTKLEVMRDRQNWIPAKGFM